jgi:glycerol kinase
MLYIFKIRISYLFFYILIEEIASQVEDTGDVYFVPAFSGLFAPRWRPDARGLIIGITQYTTKAHLVRAALEAVAFQNLEIVESMNKDSKIVLKELQVTFVLCTLYG